MCLVVGPALSTAGPYIDGACLVPCQWLCTQLFDTDGAVSVCARCDAIAIQDDSLMKLAMPSISQRCRFWPFRLMRRELNGAGGRHPRLLSAARLVPISLRMGRSFSGLLHSALFRARRSCTKPRGASLCAVPPCSSRPRLQQPRNFLKACLSSARFRTLRHPGKAEVRRRTGSILRAAPTIRTGLQGAAAHGLA